MVGRISCLTIWSEENFKGRGKEGQVVIVTPLLVGTDGAKR